MRSAVIAGLFLGDPVAGIGDDRDANVAHAQHRQPLFELRLARPHAEVGTGEEHRHVERFAARWEEFIALRGDDPITTAEARALLNASQPKLEAAEPSAQKSLSEQTSGAPEPEGEPAPDSKKAEKSASRTFPARGGGEVVQIMVEVDGWRGRLVLAETVDVLFEGQASPEAISLSAIRPATA